MTPSPWPAQVLAKERVLSGVLLLVAAMALATAADVLVRLASLAMSVEQLMFLRSVCSVALLMPIVAVTSGRAIQTDRVPLHLMRAALWSASVYLMFVAIARITLAEVNALLHTEAMFLLPLSFLFLGERITLRRVGAIVLAISGVLVISWRGLSGVTELDPIGFASGIASAATGAVLVVLLRKMAVHENKMSFLFYASLVGAAVFAWPTYANWQPIGLVDLSYIVLIAGILLLVQAMIVEAFRRGEALVLSPIFSTTIPFSAFAGWMFFGEVLGLLFWIGCAFIVAAVMLADRA